MNREDARLPVTPGPAQSSPPRRQVGVLDDLLAPADLGLALAKRAELDPSDAYVAAARLAVDVADDRQEAQRTHAAFRQASCAIAGAIDWDALASWVPFSELTKRRAEPGPMAGGAA